MININILSIKKCGDLFSDDAVKAKQEYRELMKKYHPDICNLSNANDIMSKINDLYSEAEKMFELGLNLEKSNQLLLKEKANNKQYKFNYLWEDNFELGKIYVSSTKIVYVLDKTKEKFYNNFLEKIKSIDYDNINMEKEFSRYFPKIFKNFKSDADEYIIILEKTSDIFPLKLVASKIKDHRHIAWIISRLLNIACFLYVKGLTHNGMSIDNCFINPENHSIMLYGGWWYCVNQDGKMIGTQKQIYDIMPLNAKTKKLGSFKTDLESIKMIGRSFKLNYPKAFEDFLRFSSNENSIKEFQRWNETLDNAYGKRKFINLEINKQTIYESN